MKPVKGFGRFANNWFERYAIGGLTNGTIAIVRSASGAVRDLQTGMLRGYALLMAVGTVAILLYFLIRGL